MKGKVFEKSSNIYQDEAKILFDYYLDAAEKIVKEEEGYEAQIAQLEAEKAEVQNKMKWIWLWFLGIITFFMYFVRKNQYTEQIANIEEKINDLQVKIKEIFRGYRVSKLGVAYVPVAEQVKYEDKSFMVDLTGRVDQSELTVQVPRQNDLLIKTISKLDALTHEAPIVETSNKVETIDTEDYSTSITEVNIHDYLGGLERSLETVARCMSDIDTTSVELPLVQNKSEYLDKIDEYATSEVPAGVPVIQVFDSSRYQASINKFKELNRLRDSLSTKELQFEEVLKGLMQTLAFTVQAISALKIASVDRLVLESNQELYSILKAPYNHYSPVLEHDEIERVRNESFDYSEDLDNYEPFQLKQSSRVRLNPLTGMWVAEDGSTVANPFGVHQIYEEIVAPVVQNLLRENRVERLRIYNHIKDQKLEYLNRWHQDVEAFYRANRAESSDIINIMQESLRQYVAAYNTMISLKKTEASMEQSGSLESTSVRSVADADATEREFAEQARDFKEVQEQFEQYMDDIKQDIDQQAEKFGHVEYYDARLRDGYSNETAVAASEVAELDERRRPLANVNPHLAKMSQLLPEPEMEPLVIEHFSLDLPNIAINALTNLDTPIDAVAAKRAPLTIPTEDEIEEDEQEELVEAPQDQETEEPEETDEELQEEEPEEDEDFDDEEKENEEPAEEDDEPHDEEDEDFEDEDEDEEDEEEDEDEDDLDEEDEDFDDDDDFDDDEDDLDDEDDDDDDLDDDDDDDLDDDDLDL